MAELTLRVGQYALVINPKREILIIERSRSKKWSLPGGRLDNHERDWLKALKREIFEETGINIKQAEPYKVNIVEDLPYQVKYCVYFIVKLDDIVEVSLAEEHSSFLWLNKNNCDTIEFEYSFVQRLVAEYLNEGEK